MVVLSVRAERRDDGRRAGACGPGSPGRSSGCWCSSWCWSRPSSTSSSRRKRTGDELVDQWDPAYQISQNLADRHGQRGDRACAATRSARRRRSSSPTTSTRCSESGADGTLRKYLLDHPDLLELLLEAARERSTTGTTTVGDPIIAHGAGRRPGAPPRPRRRRRRRRAFDRIRETSGDLTEPSTRARTEVAEARERAFTYVWVAIAHRYGDPPAHRPGPRPRAAPPGAGPDDGLVAQTRQVADGTLDLEIAQDGPRRDPEPGRRRRPDARRAGRPDRADRAGPAAASSSAAPSWPAPTPTSSSSPTSPRTTCRSRCARSPTSASCSSGSTPTSSTTRPASTSRFMVDGAKRMQALINDLLDVLPGRPEHRALRPGRPRPGPGPGPLTNLERAASPRPAPRSSTTRCRPCPGDPTLLTALLQNLVGNAVKYRSPDRRPASGSAHQRRAATATSELADHRRRQRHRHRPAVRRPDLHDLPAAAPARPVRRHRHRPGAVPQDRRLPPRPDVAGREGRAGC